MFTPPLFRPSVLSLAALFLFAAGTVRADLSVNVTIDPASGRAPISPYVYGTNQDFTGLVAPARRQGGNRMTGYNWENNASNAGTDYLNESDDYLTWVQGIPTAQENIPGIAVTHFHDQSVAAGTPYSLLTLQMAGYVAADKTGTVSASQAAPSSRWVAIQTTKPTAFTLLPNTSDGAVYMDEFLNFMVSRYGNATAATGVKGYDLDNEPDLWSSTHPRLHPAQPLCAELITRSVDLAKAVKRVDPAADTFGPVSYGFNGYYNFQNATDWTSEQTKGHGAYRWFLDYYLDQMKSASTTAGVRLLDVLDVHHYSEEVAGGERVTDSTNYANLDCNKGRIQAPRALWDPTFVENSWIGQYYSSFLPYLTNLQTAITSFYPGTKLSLSEYNYGGEDHISGGLAQADTLGIFGKQGVYFASFWPLHSNPIYVAAAFNLYLNYDGAGSKFGETKVLATTSDVVNASAYASVTNSSSARLHVIVLNKNYDSAAAVNFQIAGATPYTRGRIFAFDSTSATLTERTAIASISGNRFTATLPNLTAAHLVLETADASFLAWVAGSFTPAEQTDPAVSGSSADPEHSGLTNFQRYAFGLSARGWVAQAATPKVISDGGQRYLGLSFTRKTDATDVTYLVEGSADMINWIQQSTVSPGSPASVTVHDTFPMTSGQRRFLRVRAVSVP